MKKKDQPGKTLLRSEVVLSDAQLRAIGCVAAESSYLDDVLDAYIAILCCLDAHDFRVMTEGMQLQSKVEKLRVLTKARIKTEFEIEHRQLFDEIKEAITDRNNVVHGSWSVERLRQVKDEAGVIRWVAEGEAFARRKKRGKVGTELFKPKDIMDTARRIAGANLGLIHFLGKSGLSPPEYVRSRSLPAAQIPALNLDAEAKEPRATPKEDRK